MTESPAVVQDAVYEHSPYKGLLMQEPGRFMRSRIHCYVAVVRGSNTIVARQHIGSYGSSFLADGPGLEFSSFRFTPTGLEVLVAPTKAINGLHHNSSLNGESKKYCIPRRKFSKG